MPVQIDRTSAIDSSETSSNRSTPEALISTSMASFLARSSFSVSRRRPASSKFWDSTASFFLSTTSESSFSSSLNAGGVLMRLIRSREPASSIRSMALSGS